MFGRSPDCFKKLMEHFRFFSSKEPPKAVLDFPQDIVVSNSLRLTVHDGLCNALTDCHYHVLAQFLGESYKRQLKGYLLPCLHSTSSLLIANSDEKEVCGGYFQKLDQVIQYKF